MQFGKLLNNGLTLASIFMIIYFYIGSNMDDKSITILPYYIPSISSKYTKKQTICVSKIEGQLWVIKHKSAKLIYTIRWCVNCCCCYEVLTVDATDI